MLFTWKLAGFDSGDIICNRFLDAFCIGHEVFYESGFFALNQTQHIMQHQHLAGAIGARTDTYRRNGKRLSDLFGEFCWHNFHDQQTCSRFF